MLPIGAETLSVIETWALTLETNAQLETTSAAIFQME
jgi:hypothetical protein